MPIYIGQSEEPLDAGKIFIGSTQIENIKVGEPDVYSSETNVNYTAPSGWTITNNDQTGEPGSNITNIVLSRTWTGNVVYSGSASLTVGGGSLPSSLSVSTSHSSGLNNTTTITISGTFPDEDSAGTLAISGLTSTQYRYISVSYASNVPSGFASVGFSVSGAINVTHTSGSYKGYIPTTATTMSYSMSAAGVSNNNTGNPSRPIFQSHYSGGTDNFLSASAPSGASFGNWDVNLTSIGSSSAIGAGTGSLSYSLSHNVSYINTTTASVSVTGGSGGCALNTNFISNYTGVGYGNLTTGGKTVRASWSLTGSSGCNSSCQGVFVGTDAECREPLSNRQCGGWSAGTHTFSYTVAGMTGRASVTNTNPDPPNCT